ncbi:hypothetical protein FGO68_gene4803 [Halteria grandinella]|uniref:Uncharacterized protein n=1 Tax=Halteria grandinella TaxID=5974 RepID=A0A8J8NJG2_HALGN|nr:hypothetical protein FGO68_gene4803 [Halteria grandinella]
MLKDFFFLAHVHLFSRSTLYTKYHDQIKICFTNPRKIHLGKTPLYDKIYKLTSYHVVYENGTFYQGNLLYLIIREPERKPIYYHVLAPIPLTITEGDDFIMNLCPRHFLVRLIVSNSGHDEFDPNRNCSMPPQRTQLPSVSL